MSDGLLLIMCTHKLDILHQIVVQVSCYVIREGVVVCACADVCVRLWLCRVSVTT